MLQLEVGVEADEDRAPWGADSSLDLPDPVTLGTPKHSSSPDANCLLSCPSLRFLIFWRVHVSLTLYNNSGELLGEQIRFPPPQQTKGTS